MNEKRKEEIIDAFLDYTDELMDGADRINFFINCIGINKEEFSYFGIEFDKEDWKEFHRLYG